MRFAITAQPGDDDRGFAGGCPFDLVHEFDLNFNPAVKNARDPAPEHRHRLAAELRSAHHA